jgi:histidine ammonia-lyase
MIFLDGSSLTLEQLTAIADEGALVALAPDAERRIDRSRTVVDRAAEGREPVYGINTGFGALAETAIPHEALGALQLNLLRSHAAGVDDPLPARAVRATMALRANVLAKGFSGIRRSTVEHVLALLNRQVHPRVPSRGSVGASGDLAPLAHLSLVLVGEGEATVGTDREVLTGRAALARAGLEPLALGPKEGLALINGTQPSTAVAALALVGAERLARAADVAAALSIDALRGSIRPFDPRIHAARPYAGQVVSAVGSSREVGSTRRTSTAVACRTPTRCGARHRCTAPRARRSASCAGS